MTIKIQFVQGVNVGGVGIALEGIANSSVNATAVYSGGGTVVNRKWTWLDVPPASPITPGLIVDGGPPTISFTPTTYGDYHLQIEVTTSLGTVERDRRVFRIRETTADLPFPSFAAEAPAMNFGGQPRGWAPDMEEWFDFILGLDGGAAPAGDPGEIQINLNDVDLSAVPMGTIGQLVGYVDDGLGNPKVGNVNPTGATPAGDPGELQINLDDVSLGAVPMGDIGQAVGYVDDGLGNPEVGNIDVAAVPAGSVGDVVTLAGGGALAASPHVNIDDVGLVQKRDVPARGFSGSPYAVDGTTTQAVVDSGTPQTITADNLAYRTIVFTGTLTANRTVGGFTHPSSAARSYRKTIDASAITGGDVIVSTGTGTTAQVPAGTIREVLFDNTGARMTSIGGGGGFSVTGTGYPRVVAGVLQAAAVAIDLNGGATHVTNTLPIANGGTGVSTLPGSNGQLFYRASGAFGATANVSYDGTGLAINSSGYLTYGSTPATAGTTRYTNNFTVKSRNGANSGNCTLFQLNGSDIFWIGSTDADTERVSVVDINSSGGVNLLTSGSIRIGIGTTSITFSLPRHGSLTPYSSEGQATLANTTGTMAASVYSRSIWNFTTGSGGTQTIPAPANEDASYKKKVRTAVGISTTTFSIGSGTTLAVNANTTADIVVTPLGVFKIGT